MLVCCIQKDKINAANSNPFVPFRGQSVVPDDVVFLLGTLWNVPCKIELTAVGPAFPSKIQTVMGFMYRLPVLLLHDVTLPPVQEKSAMNGASSDSVDGSLRLAAKSLLDEDWPLAITTLSPGVLKTL